MLFGLAQSPFLLGGVIEEHLESWSERLPQSVAEILHSLYVDDLISGSRLDKTLNNTGAGGCKSVPC